MSPSIVPALAPGAREAELLRQGTFQDGRPISTREREQLLRPYLPSPRDASPRLAGKKLPPPFDPNSQRYSVRDVLALLIHKLLYFLMQLAFSVYIRLRQTYHALFSRLFSLLYYHHRTPELIQRDVKNLGKLPQHLSVIVDLNFEDSHVPHGPESVSRLIGEVAELAAWCTCVGIPLLSVYERTGALKTHIVSLQAETRNTFASYFPPNSQPSLHIRAAPDNRASYSPPDHSADLDDDSKPSPSAHLDILLLSASDGRATLVDLTKTLAEMAQRRKLGPADISAELIHAEIEESSCSEPDLLVVMASAAGPQQMRQKQRKKSKRRRSLDQGVASQGNATTQDFSGGGGICLQGYPPWQVRLTEIFYVQDNVGIGYQVFLRALYRYAKAEMRFGR